MVEHVDLIKSDPVFYLIPIPREYGSAVFCKTVDHLAAFPSAEFFYKVNRKVKVAKGNQRFDPIFPALVKDFIIESETCLIGSILISIRKYPCPAYGQPVTLKPHLSEKGNILFKMMIMIYSLVTWIQMFFITIQHPEFSPCNRSPVFSVGDHVDQPQAFALCIPCSLKLICGCCAAPGSAEAPSENSGCRRKNASRRTPDTPAPARRRTQRYGLRW